MNCGPIIESFFPKKLALLASPCVLFSPFNATFLQPRESLESRDRKTDCSSQMNLALFPWKFLEFLLKGVLLVKVAWLRETFVHGNILWSIEAQPVLVLVQVASRWHSFSEEHSSMSEWEWDGEIVGKRCTLIILQPNWKCFTVQSYLDMKKKRSISEFLLDPIVTEIQSFF